jgi:hypothetical protein
MTKIRKHVWVDSNLALMLDDKGIDLSAFLHLAMAGFLDVPEDPTVKLLRENMEMTVDRVRAGYLKAVRDRSTELGVAQTEEDIKKVKQNELTQKLTDLGKKLQRTSCYPKILEALKTMDSEAWCWDRALEELNSMNGDQYEIHELWNLAIEWYRKCPVPQP